MFLSGSLYFQICCCLGTYISEHVLSQRLYRSFNPLLSFPASGPSGLTPIGILLGCFFFVVLVGYLFGEAVRRCYLLLMGGVRLGCWQFGGFSGVSAERVL